MPGRRLQIASPAIFTPRAEPKWFSSARLRAAPMPAISSSSLCRIALRAAGPMRGDGEAVRLVAQALQEIQHRVARRQLERLDAVGVEPLAAGIAVRALGDRHQLHVVHAQVLPAPARAAESWPAPPSISTRSGQSVGRAALGLLLQRAA